MNWDEIADAYLSLEEDRDRIILPALMRVLGDKPSLRVVDVGGGDGRFLELLRQSHAPGFAEMALTDPSPRMRQRAAARLARFGDVTICERPESLGGAPWDIALLIAVWMCLRTERECVDLLREVAGLVGETGRVVAAVTHPCFRDRPFHSYKTAFDLHRYLEPGTEFEVTLYDGARSLSIIDTHWSISDHARQLKEAGLVIEELIELSDVERKAEGSPWLVIVARLAAER